MQRKLQSCVLPTRHRCIPHEDTKQSSHNACVDSSEATLCFSQSALVYLLFVPLFFHIVSEILKPIPKHSGYVVGVKMKLSENSCQ